MMQESANTLQAPCRSQNYNGIDAMKFICALFVVMGHIPLLNPAATDTYTPLARAITFWLDSAVCRLVNPFYFVCAGFFLFRKMPENTLDGSRAKDYCFKLCKLYGIWTVLLFTGGNWHLWFLCATVVGVALLSVLLYKHIKPTLLILIACVLYCMGILGASYFRFIEPVVSRGIANRLYTLYTFIVKNPRNGLFLAFPYILMGYFFAQEKIKLKPWISLVGFVLSWLCLIGEILLLGDHKTLTNSDLLLSYVPVTFFLFAFVSSLSLKDRPIYKKLRVVGLLVYFLHIFVHSFFVFCIKFLYNTYKIDLYPFRFPIVLCITLLWAFTIEWLSNKEKFKWIRWFLA